MRVGVLAALLAVAVAVAAVLLLYQPAKPAQPGNATVTLRVYGPGAVLVNGSARGNCTLTVKAPATLTLDASAPKGWRLKALLVNGSPALPGATRVAGNTTIEAFFERSEAALTLRVRGPGALVINGTSYGNATLTLSVPALLAINASPQPGWKLKTLLINGSQAQPGVARIAGDTVIEAVFAWGGPVVTLRVYGPGALLVNGTQYGNNTLWLEKQAALFINVSAPKGWRLRALLVNGSHASPGVTRVSGNTTIEAVFAWSGPVVTLRVYGYGYLIVNNTVYNANSTLLLEGSRTLDIGTFTIYGAWRLKALLINGSPALSDKVRIAGNTTIEAVFERLKYKVKVVPGKYPVIVNGTQVNTTVILEAWAYSGLELGPASLKINETCEAVPLWRISWEGPYIGIPRNSTEAGGLWITVQGNTTITADWIICYKPPQPVTGGVLYNGTEVKARLEPCRHWIKPMVGNWSYLGNGTWIFDAQVDVGAYLELPKNWSRVVVKGRVVQIHGSDENHLDIRLVVENGPTFYANGVGIWLGNVPGGYFEATIPRCLLQKTCGNSSEEVQSWVKPSDWLIGRTWIGPSSEPEPPPVEAGWLNLQLKGAKIQVQVIVEP